MDFSIRPPTVHTITLMPNRMVTLTSYEAAILKRIAAGEPVRVETPFAAKAVERFHGLGLVEGDGEQIAVTEVGAMVCQQVGAMDIALSGLEWMDEPWRNAVEWHLACEDIVVRNWDLWVEMETEPGARTVGAATP